MIERVRETAITEAMTEDLIHKFISSLDVFDSSKQTYQKELKVYFNWLDSEGLLDKMQTLQREDILRYKDYLKESKSSHTISGCMTVVRQFYSWLESERIYPNIAKSVKGAKKTRGYKKDCLTVSQIKNSLNNIDKATVEGKRDYALFNLLVRTGLRTIEVSRALIGDIRQETGEAVLWIQGKGREDKDDFVLLTEETLSPIHDYLNARQKAAKERGDKLREKMTEEDKKKTTVDTEEDAHKEDSPLFASLSDRNYGEALSTRSISRIVKNILIDSGLNSKRLSAHSLRHTAVTLALKGGASLQQAQAMARHSSPETTMIYVHNLDRVEHGAEKNIKI